MSFFITEMDTNGEFAKILKNSADFAVKQKKIKTAPDLTAYQKSIYSKAL